MAYTTIDRSSDYFRIKLYTGNGSTQSITFDESDNMQPDFTWIKVRNDANVTLVHDVIRGATKEIYTSLTNAEATDANGLTAFNSNGFSVGSAFGVNRNTYNFVNWSWKANGAGVSNTDGSITSTVSANTTSGFSIVSYTGTGGAGTLGHGLSAVPKMIILKERVGLENWMVYHAGNTSAPETDYLLLNSTSATADFPVWNDTAPTSSVFSIGTDSSTSTSGDTYIAYCFAEIKGFSKAFSYTGNGSTDGTFVYTGMRPAFVMIKRTDSAENWQLSDNKRSTFNVVDKGLFPNGSFAESSSSSYNIDYLSNGFKLRNTATWFNASGGTYIGIAFAESPFVTSTSIPTTAR